MDKNLVFREDKIKITFDHFRHSDTDFDNDDDKNVFDYHVDLVEGLEDIERMQHKEPAAKASTRFL